MREQTTAGLALYRPQYFENAFLYGGHDSAVCGMAKQGIALWMLGFPDQAMARAEESVALARKLRHPPSLMHALTLAVVVHQFRGDGLSLREKTEEVSRIAGREWRVGCLFQCCKASICRRWRREALSEQMPILREALAAELAGDVEKKGFCVCLFAEVCRRAGELDEGLSAVRSAISEAVTHGHAALGAGTP